MPTKHIVRVVVIFKHGAACGPMAGVRVGQPAPRIPRLASELRTVAATPHPCLLTPSHSHDGRAVRLLGISIAHKINKGATEVCWGLGGSDLRGLVPASAALCSRVFGWLLRGFMMLQRVLGVCGV